MDNHEIIQSYLSQHSYSTIEPKAALIDMDGTLYDSMRNHAAAWTRMANEEGLHVTPEEFYMYEGRTGASTINILFNREFQRDATAEEVKRLYAKKSLYFTQMPPVKVMPGVVSVLETLRSHGMQRVLVTGSGQNSLLSRLNADFPGIFFDELRITSANVTHGKPHPEPYLLAMDLVGAKPWQSIAFENAPLGVESAFRSGAFTVAVTTGPVPREALADAGASVVYDSMEQCAKLFPELLELMYTYSQKTI